MFVAPQTKPTNVICPPSLPSSMAAFRYGTIMMIMMILAAAATAATAAPPVRAPPPATSAPTIPVMKTLWKTFAPSGALSASYLSGGRLVELSTVDTTTVVTLVDISTGDVLHSPPPLVGTITSVIDDGQRILMCNQFTAQPTVSLIDTMNDAILWERSNSYCSMATNTISALNYGDSDVMMISTDDFPSQGYAVNATNGALLWRADDPTMNLFLTKVPKLGLVFTAANATETSYGVILGLDVITGHIALTLDWNFTISGQDWPQGGTLLGNGYSTPLVFIPPALFSSQMHNGTILVFDPMSGQLQHQFDLTLLPVTYAMPGDSKGFLLLVPSTAASGVALVKLTWSGTVLWTYDLLLALNAVQAPMMMYDRKNINILYLTDNGRVIALDQRNGRVLAETNEFLNLMPNWMVAGPCGVVTNAFVPSGAAETMFSQLPPSTICP